MEQFYNARTLLLHKRCNVKFLNNSFHFYQGVSRVFCTRLTAKFNSQPLVKLFDTYPTELTCHCLQVWDIKNSYEVVLY